MTRSSSRGGSLLELLVTLLLSGMVLGAVMFILVRGVERERAISVEGTLLRAGEHAALLLELDLRSAGWGELGPSGGAGRHPPPLLLAREHVVGLLTELPGEAPVVAFWSVAERRLVRQACSTSLLTSENGFAAAVIEEAFEPAHLLRAAGETDCTPPEVIARDVESVRFRYLVRDEGSGAVRFHEGRLVGDLRRQAVFVGAEIELSGGPAGHPSTVTLPAGAALGGARLGGGA